MLPRGLQGLVVQVPGHWPAVDLGVRSDRAWSVVMAGPGAPAAGVGLRADPAAWPLASDSAAVVILLHVLEQVADPAPMLAEAERVLMPFGRLLVAGFNPWSLCGLRGLAERFGNHSRDWWPQHLRSVGELRQLLAPPADAGGGRHDGVLSPAAGAAMGAARYARHGAHRPAPAAAQRRRVLPGRQQAALCGAPAALAVAAPAGLRSTLAAATGRPGGGVSQPVEIFADGACRGNPGPGGWGALLRYGEQERELWGGEAHTTNNRMELTAVIRALEVLQRPSRLHIVTDSQYVLHGITQWLAGWKRRGWRTADGKPVKNQELWQRLDELLAPHQAEWTWVRGHTGHPENERADALANRGIDELPGGKAAAGGRR